MKIISELKEASKQVYDKKIYFLVTFFSSLTLFSLNAVLRNYKILASNFSLKLLASLILGIFTSFALAPLISLVAISLLAGIVISFSVFLIKRQISTGVSMGASGILMAIVAPACPSCAVGIFSVLGLGGLFTFLPFKGHEFGVLAIGLLTFSIFYLSRKIVTKVCVIKK